MSSIFRAISGSCISEFLGKLESDYSLVVFFTSTKHDISKLTAAIQLACPRATIGGCTTAGEIGPSGITSGCISALVAQAPCKAAAHLIEDISLYSYEDGAAIVSNLAREIGTRRPELKADKHLLITLVDGMQQVEDQLCSSLVHYSSLPLVGGTAADDLLFKESIVAGSMGTSSRGAIILLVEPGVEFSTFQLNHFKSTNKKVVVTSSSGRVVHELNGAPASKVLAEIWGVSLQAIQEVDPQTIGEVRTRFAVQIGDEFFARSVYAIQGDSLLFGANLETGTILTLMKAGELVQATRLGLYSAADSIEKPAMLLAFSCISYLIYSRSTGTERAYSDGLISLASTAGFMCYGEQLNSMHMNETLTGVVFGES